MISIYEHLVYGLWQFFTVFLEDEIIVDCYFRVLFERPSLWGRLRKYITWFSGRNLCTPCNWRGARFCPQWMVSSVVLTFLINHLRTIVVCIRLPHTWYYSWRRDSKKYYAIATLNVRNAFNSQSTSDAWYSCFRDRALIYDTEYGPKTYNIKGSVLQGLMLGPLLWNIM